MIGIVDRWRDRRDQAWWERFREEHRWVALGTYNAERGRGIVHTPEWQARMAEMQAAFNAEHGYVEDRGFPIRLDPA